ncbi:hypothetical protein HMPREF9513_00082 [Enterococcus faecalis TX0645]|nr:hypothetical protein HMPREF9512_00855 [Enterococcus faecalis EnGen0311]EFU07337.1 hypothetical protein HMPREF9513_00082 [Enterococcus faecalis TX0645]
MAYCDCSVNMGVSIVCCSVEDSSITVGSSACISSITSGWTGSISISPTGTVS